MISLTTHYHFHNKIKWPPSRVKIPYTARIAKKKVDEKIQKSNFKSHLLWIDRLLRIFLDTAETNHHKGSQQWQNQRNLDAFMIKEQ